MTKNPTLPMRPEELPQQRVHIVVDLPPRPGSFKGRWDWEQGIPVNKHPGDSPAKAEYLATVEWSWSPANSRIDAYYLSSHDRYWLLWKRYFDDWSDEWAWVWSVYAYGPQKNVTARQAAVYLLVDAWSSDRDDECLDSFHMISETAALSVSDLEAISRVVWPE